MTEQGETIILPDYITEALGKAVAAQCRKIGRTDEATIRHYAAFAEEVAQAVHRAMVKQGEKVNNVRES